MSKPLSEEEIEGIAEAGGTDWILLDIKMACQYTSFWTFITMVFVILIWWQS